MDEAVKLILERMNEDYLEEVFNEIKSRFDDPDEMDSYVAVMQFRDEIFEKHFSFVKPYINDPKFYASFDLTDDKVLQQLMCGKFLISDEFYFHVIDEAARQRNNIDFEGFLTSVSDIDEFLNRGFTLEQIAEFEAIDSSIKVELYNRDHSLATSLLEGYTDGLGEIVAKEYVSGNIDALKVYLSSYSNDVRLPEVITALADYKISVRDFISDLNLYLSRRSDDDDYSCIEDQSVLEKLVSNWGPEAIVFAKTITKEAAALVPNLSYDSYIFFDGSIKRSPYILLQQLAAGNTDALFNADYRAINEEVIEVIREKKVSPEDLIKSDLTKSYLIAQYLNEFGFVGPVFHVEDSLTNVDAFNYLYSFFKDQFKGYEGYYSSWSPIVFIKNFARGEDPEHEHSYTVDAEVAKRLIELGFDFNLYITKYPKMSGFAEIMYENGEKKAIFMSSKYNYLSKHQDEFDYEDFLGFIALHPDTSQLSDFFLYKFIKEGHYDIIDYYDESTLRYLDIDRLGFKGITYEEYLNLPEKVRNMTCLRKKFIQDDPEELKQMLSVDSSDEVIYKALLAGVDPEYILNIIGYSSISFKTCKLFLEKGFYQAMEHYSRSYYEENDDMELVALFYEKSGGAIPTFHMSSDISAAFLKYYMSKGKYEIITAINRYTYIKTDVLFESGYDEELFKKYPIMDGRVVTRIINENNHNEIMDIVLSSEEYSFSNIDVLIFYIIEKGFDERYIYSLTDKYSYNVEKLLNNPLISNKEMLGLINRKSLYDNKKYLGIILDNLTPSQIKTDLSTYSVPNEMHMYIIHKMIELGHYDFVSLYKDRIVTDSLKDAILHGYFPSNMAIGKGAYAKVLASLVFTDEEIKILRSRLDKEPQYALLIPDIKKNPEVLISYLLKAPEYLKLLDSEYLKNEKVLVALVVTDPELVSWYVTNETPIETVALLIRVNPDIIGYLKGGILTREVADLTSTNVPSVIDHVYNCSTFAILNALNNGYVFNENTHPVVVTIALKNKLPVPIDYLVTNIGALFNAITYSTIFEDYTPEEFYNTFKVYFDKLRELNEIEFYYQGVRSISYSFDRIPDEYKALFVEFGFDKSEQLIPYTNDKSTFGLMFYILKNNITEENIDLLESVLDSSDNKYQLVRFISNYFNNYYYREGSKVYEFVKRMATKYFAEDPLNFVYYVDVDDPKVIEISKGLLGEHPKIYERVPKVLDDKIVILDLISRGFDVYQYLEPNFKNDLEIIEKALELNINNLYHIDGENPVIKDFLLKKLDKFPKIFTIYPEILTTKEIILKLMDVDNGLVYTYISEEFKRDFEICCAYAKSNASALFYIPNDIPDYEKIVDIAVHEFPHLFSYDVVKPYITQELYEFVAQTINDAFLSLPPEMQTLENFKLVKDKSLFNYGALDPKFLMEVVTSDILSFEDVGFTKFIIGLLLGNGSLFTENLNPKLIKLLAKSASFLETDAELFKKFLSLGADFDYSCLGPEYALVFANARAIINSTGKINTMEKNPIFSFDVCKYIFPLFGVEFTKNIIKYNTPAASVLINEIKNGNKELVVNYYNFLLENHVLENDDKMVHFAFRGFDTFRNLIIDVLSHKDQLNKDDIENLHKIIKNQNFYKINSVSELKRYVEITRDRIKTILDEQNIGNVKEFISQLFGVSLDSLKTMYEGFQLGNFSNIAFIKNKIKESMPPEEFKKVWPTLCYTKEELKLLILIKQIIYSDNIDEIKEIMRIHLDDEEKDIDYSADLQTIIDKIRRMYNLQFNTSLTKPDQLTSPRMEKDDPNNKYGVTIIDMSTEEFRFLAHRLYSYDQSNSGFAAMLMADPSLWFKLEGASTLSTSCFSDKGFWFLESNNPGGVVYLFDTLPERAMLFMYGRDLYVEHGGYRLEPTANRNAFSDVDGLVQSSNFHHGSYNEVALFREGMIPCAIACTGAEPTEDQIRAAKFFSEYTGRDIPIIRFHMPAYNQKKDDEFTANKQKFTESLDIDLIDKIILNGVDVGASSLTENVKFCFDTVKQAYQDGSISYFEFYNYMTRIIRTVNRLDHTVPEVDKEITRIILYRQSLVALTMMDRETICRLNNAEMGESGLMYRLEVEEESYLVKPAVEKGTFKRQDFRAEIQSAASKLQKTISPDTTVDVDVIKTGGIAISKQELVKINKEKTADFEHWVTYGGELDEGIKNGLLREYVVDFLLCNFDCFYGNFVIDEEGNLRGIDKEQSFRFMNDPRSLEPDFSFIPNGSARIPIYKVLFERYKRGEITLDFSVCKDTIEKARNIDEEEYREMFRAYATSLDKYHAEEILDKICSRRNIALERIEEFINNLSEDKGVKF